ncbi:S1 family peptidase [Alteromonas genovensis]|uniref:S1 family peptidase n=1 Tax=Alteromonas genovensis TaxID=471225 RepID=UPI002FE3DD8F
MKKRHVPLLLLCCLTLVMSRYSNSHAESEFPSVVQRISKSTVAIAINSPLKHSSPKILGTGFIISNGKYAVTNYHVVAQALDPSVVENYVILSGHGSDVKMLKVDVKRIDVKHDLALLNIEASDSRLSSLPISSGELLQPGNEIAFTGYPIGAILGLYPATHRGYISAITPDAIPANNSNQLTSRMLARIEAPSLIYQLDAVAYPGNSGSPVYEPTTGDVIGVINKVLVKDTKESALSAPTGISYAIPVRHVLNLMPKE